MTPSAHLVGSLPGVDAEDAMDAAMESPAALCGPGG